MPLCPLGRRCLSRENLSDRAAHVTVFKIDSDKMASLPTTPTIASTASNLCSPSAASAESVYSSVTSCLEPPTLQTESSMPSFIDSGIALSITAAVSGVAKNVYSTTILMGDFNMADVEWNEFGTPVLRNIASANAHLTNAHVTNALSYSSLVQLVANKTFSYDG
ncbi:hypothetical protein BpHYR1_016447 [Brachionus plicatilis]|uniref:RNA-directed DNA polymerase from mobile element jockey-like n=1 Tax=Brachionus plicatilis TaxID=10195 RepID=A0A3M7PNK2_BRAPC|nr:hypothetical protein BpHYR1_016447 [Brachionus plicatilis]